jgi:hypothetical protein
MFPLAHSDLLNVFTYVKNNDIKKNLLLKYLSALTETQVNQLLNQMSEDFAELPPP